MTVAEFAALDAVGQRELIRKGDVSAEEIVRAAIDRIERIDPLINAVITQRFESGVADVRNATRAGSPLFGVPMLVKDIVCHTAGDPFHCGMRVLKEHGWVERSDTFLAARFRASGLIFLGKTNTPELASSTTTEPLAYGPTRNPWNRSLSAGGSSGGSAAAVAAGLVPIAHGNDMGGSIRIPASACGVVGLKPSRGRVSLGPEFAEYLGPVTTEHVLTRSVRDSAMILDHTAGYEFGDPYGVPSPKTSFADAVAEDPAPLRIGILASAPDGDGPPLAPECVAAVDQAAALLERCGHTVSPASCPAFWSRPSGRGVVGGVQRRYEIERWERKIGRRIALEELEPLTAFWLERAATVTAREYVEVTHESQRWARVLVSSWREQHDLLLTPTLPALPPAIGELAPRSRPPDELERAMGQHVFYTAPFNVTGEPAISLPLHWTESGLPVGVQFVAPYGREDLLLSVAGQLERAAPWHRRYARLTL